MAAPTPTQENNVVVWLRNFSAQLPKHAQSLSMTNTQIKEQQEHCEELMKTIQLHEQKRAEYQVTMTQIALTKERELNALRDFTRRIKTSPNYTEAMGQDMQFMDEAMNHMLSDVKPDIRVESQNGFVRVGFKQGKFDGVNIYRRLKGEPHWHFIMYQVHSPYDDHTPVKHSNKTENREYYVHGVVRDEEVGTASDVVSILVQNSP